MPVSVPKLIKFIIGVLSLLITFLKNDSDDNEDDK